MGRSPLGHRILKKNLGTIEYDNNDFLGWTLAMKLRKNMWYNCKKMCQIIENILEEKK